MVRGRWRVEVANLCIMLVVFCFQTLKNRKKSLYFEFSYKKQKTKNKVKIQIQIQIQKTKLAI